MRVRSALLLVAISTGSLGIACGVAAKKEVAHATLSTMSESGRRESFEATLELLDEKPELVDEFYSVARRHAPTMNRFVANTARDLHEPELATETAESLAKHPDSVEQVLERTTDEVAKSPEARKAMNRAVASRSDEMVDIITDDPDTLGRMVATSLATIEKKSAARTAVLAAVKKNRGRVVAFVKSDPQFSKEVAEQLLREVVEDKPALEKALRALGIIDDDGPDAKAKAKKKP